MRKQVDITVTYPFNVDTFDIIENKLIKIAKTYKGESTGGGCGFSGRDVSFTFKTKTSANSSIVKMEEYLKTQFKGGFRIEENEE